MRAIGYREFGPPTVLEEIELPIPQPDIGEVRVRVAAATVNPTDLLRRSGKLALNGEPDRDLESQGFPQVPGMEFAGTIDLIGPNVSPFLRVGQRVLGTLMPHGTLGAYADFVIVSARSIVPIPNNVSDVAAATLPMNGLTAMSALEKLAIPSGGTIGVTGGAGAFGGYVIQLAKCAGLKVIADSSPKDYNLLKELGADHIVERGDNLAQQILDVFPEGVDGIADGAVLNEKLVAAVRDGGTIATVRHFEPRETIDGVAFRAIRVSQLLESRERLQQLAKFAQDKVLKLRVSEILPPAKAAEAHVRLAAGGTRGRFILDFASTPH